MSTKPSKRIEVVSLRMVREKPALFYPNRFIRSPKDAADLFRQFIDDCDREVFCILCMNSKNEPTAIHQVSTGTLNASLVHPRETFKLAILNNSASLIATTTPLGMLTLALRIRRLRRDSGILLGIYLLDHLVLGYDSFVSMKERGLM